jgi:hypothetical protein
VACDERATSILQQVYAHGAAGCPGDVRGLLARSLGDPRYFSIASSRSRVMERAATLGIRIPPGDNLSSPAALENWLQVHGYPAYLKADGSSGGVGVRRIANLQEGVTAFRKLNAPPILARVLKRLVVDRDPMLVMPFLTREHPEISIQQAIDGREATCAIACWQGQVLSTLSMEVLQRTEDRGPASVLRHIENAEMVRAAELMVKSLGLSGLVGLDFMLEESTGAAYLLELNLRATQTAHLCMGPNHAPAYALGAKLQGLGTQTISFERHRDVALFPQEWLRDPQSAYLTNSFHDVPTQAPELIKEALSKGNREYRDMSSEQCLQTLLGHAPHSAAA